MIIFSLAVFFLLITPGPGVLSTAGIGSAFGFKSGIRYVFGLFIGTNIVAIIVISGLATVIFSFPIVRTICLFLSSIFFIYLALKIIMSDLKLNFLKSQDVPGIAYGLVLQLINPKAYIVNITFYSGFAFYPANFGLEILFKLIITNLIWIPIHLIWLYAGVLLYEMPLSEKVRNKLKFVMGTSLIIVVLLSIISL